MLGPIWSSPNKSSQITKDSSAYHNTCLGPWELSRQLAEKDNCSMVEYLGPWSSPSFSSWMASL